jgi:hypothetical protein
LLRTNRSLAVTGAGVSVWAGYPPWPGVIRDLGEAVRRENRGEVDTETVIRNSTNPLHCAQRLGNYLGSKFGDFIRSEFGPNGTTPNDVVFKIASLPFRHFLSFNFDTSGEQAHAALRLACGSISVSNPRDMVIFMREMERPDYGRQFVHLHGVFTDPPQLIALTEEGFSRLYHKDPFFRNLLWSVVTSKRLVFLGFGFSDTDFTHLLRDAARDVRDNGLAHFAILGIEEDVDDGQVRYRFNDEYLIEPVFYQLDVDAANRHRGFVELINGIASELAVPSPVSGAATRQLETQVEQPAPEDLRRVEQLADALLERIDPGGNDVQG